MVQFHKWFCIFAKSQTIYGIRKKYTRDYREYALGKDQ